jgi:hypothetical protein
MLRAAVAGALAAVLPVPQLFEFARYCTDLGSYGNLLGGWPFGRGVAHGGSRVE